VDAQQLRCSGRHLTQTLWHKWHGMKYINIIALIVLVICLNGCLSDSQADAYVDFETVISGVTPVNGVLGNRKIEFFHSQLSYDEAVSRYSAMPTEQIDFSVNQVVLLDMGEKPTGGYAIKVDSVEKIDGTLKLNAAEIRPGTECVVTQALTAPYLFVKVLSVERVEAIIVKSKVVDRNAP
jgi:hypothetical protein